MIELLSTLIVAFGLLLLLIGLFLSGRGETRQAGRSLTGFGIFLIAVAVIGTAVARLQVDSISSSPINDPEEERVTPPRRLLLMGTVTCLPHADTSGPVTMECAIGLEAEDGKYYALDFNVLETSEAFGLETGTRVEAEGLFTPLMALSTDHWAKYNVEGILTVTMLKRL